MVYVEGLIGQIYLEGDFDMRRYGRVFRRLEMASPGVMEGERSWRKCRRSKGHDPLMAESESTASQTCRHLRVLARPYGHGEQATRRGLVMHVSQKLR